MDPHCCGESAELQPANKEFGIGSALREGLVGTVDEGLEVTIEHVTAFSKTTAGKATIAVVVWKVLGRDVIRLVMGITLLSLCAVGTSRILRVMLTGRKILKKQEGKVKTWEHKPGLWGTNALSSDAHIGIWVAWLIFFGFTFGFGVGALLGI